MRGQRQRQPTFQSLGECARLVRDDDRKHRVRPRRERSVEIRRERTGARRVIGNACDPQAVHRGAFIHQQPDSSSTQACDELERLTVDLVVAEYGDDRNGIRQCTHALEKLRNEIRIIVDEIAREQDDVR